GLLIDPEFGGSGAPLARFAPFLTKMDTVDATVAGLASVHGCIGAVDPVRTFATPEQKKRMMPPLASGEKFPAFALPALAAGLWALKHTNNNGLLFNKFRVPKENLLKPPIGDGLTIAYHGLNLGRLSLCANAAGTMRYMLASILPWAAFRRTYGQPIQTRELV